MFSWLAPYRLLIEVFVIGSLVAGVVYGAHRFLMYEQDIGYQRAVMEYTAKQLAAEQAARAREEQLQKQVEDAQNAAAQREQTIRSLSAAAADSGNGLRDAIAANQRNGMSSASVDALGRSVQTLGGLLAECSDRYRGMAENAERERSNKQTLIDAWPR